MFTLSCTSHLWDKGSALLLALPQSPCTGLTWIASVTFYLTPTLLSNPFCTLQPLTCFRQPGCQPFCFPGFKPFHCSSLPPCYSFIPTQDTHWHPSDGLCYQCPWDPGIPHCMGSGALTPPMGAILTPSCPRHEGNGMGEAALRQGWVLLTLRKPKHHSHSTRHTQQSAFMVSLPGLSPTEAGLSICSVPDTQNEANIEHVSDTAE